jgi:hypothetical protein
MFELTTSEDDFTFISVLRFDRGGFASLGAMMNSPHTSQNSSRQPAIGERRNRQLNIPLSAPRTAQRNQGSCYNRSIYGVRMEHYVNEENYVPGFVPKLAYGGSP